MKIIRYALLMLLFFMLYPAVISAESDFYRMDVGEERTFTVPYSVSGTDISTYYWSNNSPSAVEIVSSSFYSITVKVLQYQYSRVLLQLDYYRLSDGRRETYDLNIDIREPDSTSDSTPDSTPDPVSNQSIYDVEINATNFPDANFRAFLSEQNYGVDGVITEGEIMVLTRLNVTSSNISDLTGIEHFVALKSLYCGNNALTSLDLTKNTILTHLVICDNQLTSLDVSKNTLLKELSCYNNALTSLDLSQNTALEVLDCINNALVSLDVSNTSLKELWCYQNQIKGSEMDKLIESLVTNNSGKEYQFLVIKDDSQEGNVCTSTQVSAAKAKGWTPYCMGQWKAYVYAGSDPSGINGVMMDTDVNLPVFGLGGQRLEKPRKGINIIGGKKVMVK